MTAEPCLHVADHDALEKTDERAGEDRRGVALHQDDVGLVVPHDVLEPVQGSVHDPVQALPFLHDVEVVVGSEAEDGQRLVDERRVLPGERDARLDLGRMRGER